MWLIFQLKLGLLEIGGKNEWKEVNYDIKMGLFLIGLAYGYIYRDVYVRILVRYI